MDNNTIDQWARDTLHATGHSDAQIEAMRVKETAKAKQKSEPYIPLTNDELRSKRAGIVREELDRYQPGHGCTEEEIKAHVAVTHSDEAIAEHARLWRAQQRAERDRYAAEWTKDEAAKKAAGTLQKVNDTKLADANSKAMTYQERAEAAESKADGLERQITGLLKGQRT
jgi:hypothetical protein